MVKIKIALTWLAFMILLVIIGPVISTQQADIIHWDAMAQAPNGTFWFGTDVMGRDLFVRTLLGGRLSLMVAFIATAMSLLIGVSYGLFSGYRGGVVDAVMMRFLDVLYALPFLFLVILLLVFFGQHIGLLFAAIGGYIWLDTARIVRGQTLVIKKQAYMEAAVTMGQSTPRILSKHILPNLIGVVVVYATLTVPQVILIESFISFLGLGVQEPNTSWGTLISEGVDNLQIAPWSLFIPAGFLSLTLIAFNLLGDGLRDYWDPHNLGLR